MVDDLSRKMVTVSRGVYLNGDRYLVRHKNKYVGVYKDLQTAKDAYWQAKKRMSLGVVSSHCVVPNLNLYTNFDESLIRTVVNKIIKLRPQHIILLGNTFAIPELQDMDVESERAKITGISAYDRIKKDWSKLKKLFARIPNARYKPDFYFFEGVQENRLTQLNIDGISVLDLIDKNWHKISLDQILELDSINYSHLAPKKLDKDKHLIVSSFPDLKISTKYSDVLEKNIHLINLGNFENGHILSVYNLHNDNLSIDLSNIQSLKQGFI